MKDDYTTNSRYFTYILSLKGWENVLFEFRIEHFLIGIKTETAFSGVLQFLKMSKFCLRH